MSDFYSFTEAMSELQLSKEELESLVANGELRGFHDGDDVRFKREDIAAMKKSRETEPTIVLSDTHATGSAGDDGASAIDLDSISTDETVLNIEGLLEDESEGTTPIPGGGILEGEDEIELSSVGEDTVLDTEGIDLDDDFDLGEDDTLLAEEEDTLIRGGGVRRVQMVRKESHTGMTVTLAATVLVLLGPLAIVLNLISEPGGSYPGWVSERLTILNPVAEWVAGLF